MKRILSFLLKLKANEERFLRRMLNIFKWSGGSRENEPGNI
jgi:hypothetical protein